LLTWCYYRIPAEDIEAVFDQDPQRVCILQGPVAVNHAKVKDEPIKDILGNITSALVDKLVGRVYGGDSSKIPTIDYVGAKPDAVPQLETLAGSQLTWSRALLTSPTIVQGTSNPIRRLLAPRRGQKVVVSPTSITITVYSVAHTVLTRMASK
jgi:fatty acid synthase subunit alpha, fungi type